MTNFNHKDINQIKNEYNKMRDTLRKRYKVMESHNQTHLRMPEPFSEIPKGLEYEYYRRYKKTFLDNYKNSYSGIIRAEKFKTKATLKALEPYELDKVKNKRTLKMYGNFMNEMKDKYMKVYGMDSGQVAKLYNYAKRKNISKQRIDELFHKWEEKKENLNENLASKLTDIEANENSLTRDMLLNMLKK